MIKRNYKRSPEILSLKKNVFHSNEKMISFLLMLKVQKTEKIPCSRKTKNKLKLFDCK